MKLQITVFREINRLRKTIIKYFLLYVKSRINLYKHLCGYIHTYVTTKRERGLWGRV